MGDSLASMQDGGSQFYAVTKDSAEAKVGKIGPQIEDFLSALRTEYVDGVHGSVGIFFQSQGGKQLEQHHSDKMGQVESRVREGLVRGGPQAAMQAIRKNEEILEAFFQSSYFMFHTSSFSHHFRVAQSGS